MRRWPVVACLLAGVAVGLVTSTAATPAPDRAHTVAYDRWSLKIDGRRTFLWAGEFHPFRLPSPDAWRDVLEKMKAGGYNAVSVYFDWAYHSPRRGVYDFTGVRDAGRLLDIAAQVGIYVIARPGPYINAEVDAGGFPGWLLTQKGRARSNARDYTSAYREWLRHIDPIIARHQYTDGGGTVILYQVENEYGRNTDAGYMRQIERQARTDGIDVPFTHNHCCGSSTWANGPGAVDIPGQDDYPQGFDCRRPGRWNPVGDLPRRRGDSPIFGPEYQGGAFDPWGGAGYGRCRRLTGPAFQRIAYEHQLAIGATMLSFYMTYGGTSWGWLPDPAKVYTSYDYGAPIAEDRSLTPKYEQSKLLGMMLAASPQLARTEPLRTARPSAPGVRLSGRVARDGTRMYVLAHGDTGSRADDRTHIAIDLGGGDSYPSVPQQRGTAITMAGRDSKLLVAGYRFGRQRLQYSTSELMTHATIGGRDVAVLHGRRGEDGETVLRYARRPAVQALDGGVTQSWDARRGDLRLDYVHRGLARVLVTPPGGRALLLLIGTDDTAGDVWRQDAGGATVIERGPELVRTARRRGATLALTGDTDAPSALDVYAPPGVSSVTWNGRPVAVSRGRDGALHGQLAGPAPVRLPPLGDWRTQAGSPESDPGFDDSGWKRADHRGTANPTRPTTRPVLYADDYGFHHGDVWYRGHFRAGGGERAVRLGAITGRSGTWSVWLNGRFLGSTDDRSHRFRFPAGIVRTGADNVLSALVENMGHNEDFSADDDHKEPRGLTGARLVGSNTTLRWRIEGNLGGEDLADPVRGPFNAGGLYGERVGWQLPGFPDAGWQHTSLPSRDTRPGERWYRTTFGLSLPAGQDVPVGVRIDDDHGRRYRALIFVNGWLVGRYINHVGPQTSFSVPPGILRARGQNTLAIAVWNEDASSGGLGRVSLEGYGNYATSLRVRDVDSPGYGSVRTERPSG